MQARPKRVEGLKARAARGQQPQTFLIRVIRDSRDASRDYFIPRSEAERKYFAGTLAWDLDNKCYTEPAAKLALKGLGTPAIGE